MVEQPGGIDSPTALAAPSSSWREPCNMIETTRAACYPHR
jgi:hypothetical protein